MNAKERLLHVQSALTRDGVHDVKFYFAAGFTGRPTSEVFAQVADALMVYRAAKEAKKQPIREAALA